MISPDDASDLGAETAENYAKAEIETIGRIARFLRVGIDTDQWEHDRRNGAGALRRILGQLLGVFFRRGRSAAEQAVREAVRRGVAEADREIGSVAPHKPADHHATRAVDRISRDLGSVEQSMARNAMDAYHRIITQASVPVVEGTATRRKAAERALARFADAGITGFVDKAGRRWEIASYVEMAVRTHVANAMIDAHAQRLQDAGMNLVMVSQAPYECPLCKPWEGKILTLSDRSGEHQVKAKSAATGRQVTVQVAGSLSEARLKGLLHPNCRHTVEAYLPGVTRKPEKPNVGSVAYQDTQQQRYLERQARKWDRRRAAAISDEERRKADAAFKGYRARVRQLTAATGLPRKTHRERHDQAR